jgi:hypothetical protein
MPESTRSVPDRVRAGCAWVSTRALSVSIAQDAIETYAAGLPLAETTRPDPATHFAEGDREARAAFVVCLDAINFGSGWWPTIHKRSGRSGYSTIAAGVTERFRAAGEWSALELSGIEAAEIAGVLGQEAEHPLMSQYATALRDVGRHVLTEHEGSFEALIDAAGGSASALADLLAGWEAFADVSEYEDRPVPLFKRAQIAAADVNRLGVAPLVGEERLTAFADNLVPHVLRIDGVLRLDPDLVGRIEAGQLLEHGSPEEVELRACAVHAIELLSAASPAHLCPAEIDAALWHRGSGQHYKATRRPRSRNTCY